MQQQQKRSIFSDWGKDHVSAAIFPIILCRVCTSRSKQVSMYIRYHNEAKAFLNSHFGFVVRALSFYEGPIAQKLFQLGRTTQGMPGSGHQLISFLATGNFLFQNSSRETICLSGCGVKPCGTCLYVAQGQKIFKKNMFFPPL